MNGFKALCPSAPCEEGAVLIGRVTADGTVAFINTPIHVTDVFFRETAKGKNTEKRFRFAASFRAAA